MLFANIGDPSAGRSLQGHRPTSAETELCRPTEPRVPQPHGGHPGGNSDILSSSCDSLEQKSLREQTQIHIIHEMLSYNHYHRYHLQAHFCPAWPSYATTVNQPLAESPIIKCPPR